jgi:hypothetical protein
MASAESPILFMTSQKAAIARAMLWHMISGGFGARSFTERDA